ncbi:MAG: DUF423 domain-containing protein [Candidatus Hydrogenedentota bacterium]
MASPQDRFRKITAVLGVAGVGLGAFGAHGLEDRLSVEMLEVYQTGVFYHLIHVVALFALTLASESLWQGKAATRVAISWVLGIILFSGSLYVLAVSGISKLGMITPFGGLAFIAGWVFIVGLRPNGTQS